MVNVRELSGLTTEYLEILNEFARMDNTLTEATALTNTAQIFTNISDLNAQESVNTLTAATLAFNIAKEDSIRIADTLNEVDNNYSVTTKDLALSMNKAAQSSKTYGVSLEQLVGYTTAVSAATRETGNVTGNSLKTIFSRMATLPKAQDAMAAVGVSVRNSSGEMRKIGDVINDLGSKWKSLSAEQQQNLLINVAGTYQQNRLAALMNNFKMATDSTTTAIESQGSAMREQEKYNQSLEGRLNRLDTAWTSFSKSAGDTVIYDGIVVATSALEKMTDSGNGVVSTIGLLPPVITVATVAVYAFSGSFRALTLRTYEQASATVAATGATGVFSGALVGLRTVAGLATVALKGLAIATGIGVAFSVVGVVIEKLTNVISDNIQKQEEFDTYLKNNASALTDNREAVENLITKYGELSSAKENGNAWDSTKEEEYLKVQQRLGELYPALISYTDASGQAHLKTSEEIKKEVDATNELIEAQNKVTLAKAVEEFDKFNEKVDGAWYDSFSNYIYGSLESQIKNQKQIIEAMQKNGVDTSEQEYELLKLEQQVVDTSDQIKGKMLEVANAVDEVKIEPSVAKDMENFLRGLDVSNLDSAQLKDFSTNFGKLQTQLQEAINNGDKKLYKETVDSINELAKSTNNADFKEFKTDFVELVNSISDGKNAIVDAEVEIDGLGNEAEGSKEQLSELASKMQDFKDVTEQMAGVSQSGVDALNDLIFQYDTLSNQVAGYTQQQLQDIYVKENLSAEEQRVKDVLDKRVAVMKELSGVYPDLLGKDDKAIALSDEKRKAIEEESKANEVLLKGYKLARDGKLSAEEQATLASATATRARIENIKKEIQALSILQTKLQEAYDDAMDSMKDEDPNSYTYGMKAARASTLLGQAQSQISNYTSELDDLQGSLNTNIGTIDSFNTAIENSSKSTNSNTKATKENNAEKEKSIWITDKYKQKLEELTLAIEKQQKIQSKHSDYSKEYKKSLEAQIKLEKEKLALQQKQAKAVQAQIASGKIQQVGSVSANSNGNIKGYTGKITSGYGERKDNHRGIDIAMDTGTRVDAPVSGKVIKAGSATSDTNGKKMDWTYGNLVVIEDKDGIRHLLAHLDSTLVKVGDQVEAGTQIGNSGNSGNTSGAHLHYEQNNSKGQTINPTATLNAIRSGGSSASSASSQQAIVWNYFKNKGLNDNAIAGLMGNIQQESSFNSSLVNKSTGASGIFQWLGGRKNGLQDYAKSIGKSWTDLQVQLDYAWKELNGSEKKALASLQRSDLSSSQHASEFERLYERSGGSQIAKRQDYANQYYNQYAGTNGGAGVGIDTSQQAIDQAKSDLNGLESDVLNTKDTIDNLNELLVKSNLSYYDHLIEGIDRSIQKSNILASQQSEYSKAYRDELEKETKHLKYKQDLLHNEANFIRNQLKRKDLSPALKDELTNQLSELSLSWWDVAESIKEVDNKIQNSKVESIIVKYEELRQIQDKAINNEKANIEELDTSSARYVKTLANINNAMREKQNSNRYELTQLTALVNGNKLSGEALESTRNRIEELTIGIKELQIAIQNGDYDILINIKTQSDEKVGLMDSAINQAEAIRKMFDEGSADYVKYTKIILEEYEKMAKQHLATRDALVEELKQRDITAERIKEVKKLITDEQLAYLNATLSIKDYTKQVEEANKSQLESIADKAINAYKEYIQERRDEHIKTLDDEIKRENEKHEQIIKNLNDEMDLFRKNVDEKLKLIDRQESQRSYDMEISDLEKERNDIQSQFDDLALDKSHEGKAKRKKLKEQLDEIDKQIEEKRHNREIELRKESLNDALEAKEEEVNEKIELQDKEHENVINKINREKEYWEKHYKDLLNDERKFAEMREAILSGHFEKVDAEFKKFADEMRATMPELADTLDDTMQAVGMTIRQNVIDNLEEALKLFKEFKDSQISTDDGSFNFNPNIDNGNGTQTSNGSLTQGDLQVLLGKFLYDNVSAQTSGKDKDAVRQMAEQLAEQGRKNGSTQFTKDDVNFNDSIKGLTQADIDSLYEYFDSNKGILGGKYDGFIEQFINSISGNKHEATNDGSLSKADMQVMLGKFIYEKIVPDKSLSANTKTALKAKADGIASQGRRSGSEIKDSVTFDSIKSTYSSAQVNQLKSFFDSNLGMIDNATTRDLMQKKIASLDTGGFMNWTGTGIDGKGGKAIIAHPHEIMLDKVDTKGFFNSINVMDKIMSSLSPILSKFTPPQKTTSVVSGDTYGDIKINFNIDKMNGDKNDLNKFNKMIDDDLLRRKGMRK
ncbi:phage tail tape measure protein [Lysinibacillus sp. M3]|uniref:Phage tail tape measure protein n=1 Tax=Lysinibacillus zambalensis TaxID=3160866 RepID=A0ABV1MTM9_9BACI